MTGKTHLVCGEALALCLLHPAAPRTLVLCLGAAAVGSVIPDVDVTTSASHRELVRIVSTAGAALLLGWALNTIFQLHIERFLLRYAGGREMTAWAVLFLGLCVFGTTQPHRSFMHSLAGLALLTFCVWRGGGAAGGRLLRGHGLPYPPGPVQQEGGAAVVSLAVELVAGALLRRWDSGLGAVRRGQPAAGHWHCGVSVIARRRLPQLP